MPVVGMQPTEVRARPPSARGPFTPTEAMKRLGRILKPEDSEGPILPQATRTAVHHWLVELGAEADFKAVGLQRRATQMLAGPPGCGKTTLAHHLAHRLGLPLLVVDMAQLIGQFLGETGKNINALFADCEAQARKMILLLDEFDAIGIKRGGRLATAGDADRNAVVIHLLQVIDRYDGILIAATNQPKTIDPAIWRRFKIHLTLAEPGEDERFAIMKRYLAPLEIDDEFLDALVGVTGDATPALLRELMEGIKREFVLCRRLDGNFADGHAVVSRVLATVRPHEETRTPHLWTPGGIDDLEDAWRLWPPQMKESP